MTRLSRLALVIWLFLSINFNLAAQCHGSGNGGSSAGHSGHTANAGKQNIDGKKSYTCSMHPEIVSPIPGKCPKCGMALAQQKISTCEKRESKVYYSCSIHPSILSDKKGKCTVCGKKLKKGKTFSFE